MSAPAKTSAIKIPAVQGAKTPARSQAVSPGKASAKVPAAKEGLKPESDDLDLKIPDEITLAPALGPALELIPQDPDVKSVTKGGRGPITKKRKRPAGHAASSSSGRAEKSGGSGRSEKAGKRREKAPPVVLIIGIPVILLGVGIVFLLGGGKPSPSHTAPAATPAPKREPAAVFVPKGLNDPAPSTPAPAAATSPAPADGPPPAPPKPGSGRTPEEREAQKAAEEEIAAQKKLIEERTKRLGGESTGAAAPAAPTPETPASE